MLLMTGFYLNLHQLFNYKKIAFTVIKKQKVLKTKFDKSSNIDLIETVFILRG